MRRLIATILVAINALPVYAGGLESLENFIHTANSGRAEFTQVVTAPASGAQPARSKTSTGSFEFLRPGRFRFDYKRPFEQTIVADGQTLWLYDVDLNQVTARKQSQVLGSTPAALIAAAPNLASLRKDFDLQEMPDREGLQWIRAMPTAKDGQLSAVQLGFRGGQLAVLEILDSFGQRSVMTFKNFELNAPVSPQAFQFRPPQGADVVRP